MGVDTRVDLYASVQPKDFNVQGWAAWFRMVMFYIAVMFVSIYGTILVFSLMVAALSDVAAMQVGLTHREGFVYQTPLTITNSLTSLRYSAVAIVNFCIRVVYYSFMGVAAGFSGMRDYMHDAVNVQDIEL